MKNFVLMTILSFSLMACDRTDKPSNPTSTNQSYNAGKNLGDRDRAKTSEDQSEKPADLAITQKIRQAIVSDNSLSVNARNIKIITVNGVVTLRGVVASSQEKDAIARKVNGVQGIMKVDNQLEVNRSN